MRRRATKRNLAALLVLCAAGLAVFAGLTRPSPYKAQDIPAHTANIENGKLLFNAGGCISCHASAADAAVPAGGKPLKTPIGTFYPPNLTPEPETGLGGWSDVQFINAMKKGIGADGAYLIPAFPYASYTHMSMGDILDIKAYLASLPPVKNEAKAADIPVAFILRRGLGLWQWLGLNRAEFQPDSTQSASWNRGAYLVNGPGHCQECHTPRNLFMALKSSAAFAGGPHPEGTGKVPSLRGLVERGRFKDVGDLVLAFQQGEVMGYDHISSGGMGEVQNNLSKLPEADLKAMAEYLLSLK